MAQTLNPLLNLHKSSEASEADYLSFYHISNLMLVVNNTPTRVGYQRLEDGKKVRFAKKIGETVNE